MTHCLIFCRYTEWWYWLEQRIFPASTRLVGYDSRYELIWRYSKDNEEIARCSRAPMKFITTSLPHCLEYTNKLTTNLALRIKHLKSNTKTLLYFDHSDLTVPITFASKN